MKNYFPILIFVFAFATSGSGQDTIGKKLNHKKPNNFLVDKRIVSMVFDTASGFLTWQTINEKDTSHFIIEECRWNKYYKLAEVKGLGKKKSTYSVRLPVDSGLFYLRVGKWDKGIFFGKGMDVPRKAIHHHGIADSRDYILLDAITRYEIYDKYGKILKQGYAREIDVRGLGPGVYYCNYENSTTEFIRSKKK